MNGECWAYIRLCKGESVNMDYNPVTSNPMYLPRHLELIVTCYWDCHPKVWGKWWLPEYG